MFILTPPDPRDLTAPSADSGVGVGASTQMEPEEGGLRVKDEEAS